MPTTAEENLEQAFDGLRARENHAAEVHKLRPLHDRVVIRPDQREDRSTGGIILPDVAQEKPQMGTVLAVGPGRVDQSGHHHKCGVKHGDRVLFGKYSGSDIKIDGERLLIMRDEDCIAVIDDEVA